MGDIANSATSPLLSAAKRRCDLPVVALSLRTVGVAQRFAVVAVAALVAMGSRPAAVPLWQLEWLL